MAVTTSITRSVLVPDTTIGNFNSNGGGDNVSVDVVIASNGNALVTYNDPVNNSTDIVLDYLDDTGSLATFDNEINTTTTNFQGNARSATLSNGNHVFVFDDQSSSTTAPDIRASIFTPDGFPAFHNGNGTLGSNDFVVRDAGTFTNGVKDPDVTALSGGGFMTVWVADDSANTIKGRKHSNDGVIVDTFIPVTSSTSASTQHSAPRITELSNGNVVVAWLSDDGFGGVDVQAQIFDATGSEVTAVGGLITVESSGINADIQLAANTTGGFVIAFTRSPGTNSRIQMGEFNASGVFQHGGFITPVNSGTSATDLLHTGADTWVLAYDDILSATDTDTRIKVLESTGSAFIDKFDGSVGFDGDLERGMALAAYGDGRFIGAFEDQNDGTGSDFEVSAEIFSLTRTTTGDGASDTIVGDDMIDIINGGDGTNNMTGGKGNDQITGGANQDNFVATLNDGDDTYTGNGGIDVLDYSAITVAITANLQTRTITSAQTGTDTLTDDFEVFIGGSAGDDITGNGLNNTLTGGGGGDTMRGGLGDDSYDVDSASDIIIENAAEGTDGVFASVSYILPGNVENLTLKSGSGTINGTGNALGNTISGNSFANTLNGQGGADTFFGNGGGDTFVVDNAGDQVFQSADGLTDQVNASVSFTLGSNLENLTLLGTGNFGGTGNSLVNTIIGNSGNNTIDGKGGADNMIGGGGDDTYVVDNAGDSISEGAGAGVDQVNSTVGYTLFANLEHLSLLGSANGNAIGNAENNNLFGNSGDNTIDGLAGADNMIGGEGNDIFVVDNVGDSVSDSPGVSGGTDHVNSFVSFTLFAFLENLTLLGTGDNNAIGNSENNVLIGNSGMNTLDGLGGADTMVGGRGNDIYVVDNAGDTVTEGPILGDIDQVNSSVSFTLVDNVENLSLLGSADIDAIGNSENNVLIGNSGNNTLDGLLGGDTMVGGAGDDIYVVNQSDDTVSESPGGGTDQVNSFTSFTLVDNIENLSLLGSNPNNAIGNGLSNILIGNSNENTLDGLAGADTMVGGDGGDTYVVDNAGDVVSESPNQGLDQVNSSVSFTLFANIENLSLLGSGNINATGNELANNLFGNSGNNTIRGNAGNDVLIGNAGNDIFVMGSGMDSDTINDFNAGAGLSDRIDVSAFGFADFNAVLAATTDAGGSAPSLIDFGNGDQVILLGVAKTDLVEDDFILS